VNARGTRPEDGRADSPGNDAGSHPRRSGAREDAVTSVAPFDAPLDESKSARDTASAEPVRPERVCPNCGRALLERKCKLLCPNLECGYYMSCSDFY